MANVVIKVGHVLSRQKRVRNGGRMQQCWYK
jgi:hypothetical protein